MPTYNYIERDSSSNTLKMLSTMEHDTHRDYAKKRKLKILIVDDDSDVALLLKQIIEIYDHEVYIVDDGLKCITHCQEETYDLIFMDYHMDELDGTDVVSIIKNIQKHSLIFAFTGDISNLQLFKDVGFNGVVVKPVDMRSIQFLISNLELRSELDDEIMTQITKHGKNNIIFF
jgi:CheY-like chemotaxis protein